MSGAIMAEWDGAATARASPVGMAGSVVLHAALLAALFLLTPLRTFVAPEPAAISVDLIPSSAFNPAPEPDTQPRLASPAAEGVPATDTAPATAPLPAAPVEKADGVFHATTLYAARMLRQPDMASVRRGLRTVTEDERVVQLCNIEGLEQIRRAAPQYDPDTMVSYAMADLVASGLMLTATGAAFRSRRLWYGVSFECVAAPGLDGVTSFSFKLGEAIPESEWEAHNLNAEDKAE